jgi:heme-degrading monooxygenase HmoA
VERGVRRHSVIARYWAATTTKENAPLYAHHLTTSVFPELQRLSGYEGGKLLQRDDRGRVEVIVITFWESLDSIRAFAGDDLEQAVVPDKAAAFLSDYDRRVKHFEVVAGQ